MEVNATIPDIEEQEAIFGESHTNDRCAHSGGAGRGLHQVVDVIIGRSDRGGTSPWLGKLIGGMFGQEVEYSAAGQSSVDVPTHAVCDHEPVLVEVQVEAKSSWYFALDDVAINGDGVLVGWAYEAAMGKGNSLPRH
jgi:hypothetical protein